MEDTPKTNKSAGHAKAKRGRPKKKPGYDRTKIIDELPNSLEAEISGGNQLIMNYEQAQELFGIKFRRWLGIFNL